MTYPYVAGAVLLASDLNTDFAAKSDNAPAITAPGTTTYTFTLADATSGKTVTASNASASTYTIPPQSSAAFSTGALLKVYNLGAGVVTFAGGVGVTVTNTAGTLAQYQTATLVRTGSDAWTVIPAGGASGLTLIATATASASSAVSINGCFTSAYDNYRIVCYLAGSASLTISTRLRVGGTDNSAAAYDYAGLVAQNASIFGLTQAGGTSWLASSGTGTVADPIVIEIMRPALAASTGFILDSYRGTDRYRVAIAGIHTAATAFDGLTFIPSTGTLTGTARVYGYRNS